MMRAAMFLLLVFLAWSLCLPNVDAANGLPKPVRLQWHYYKLTNSCKDAEVYVRHQVKLFWDKDKSITAKFLRLIYTDCFVTGCDASILLDGPDSEKTALQNKGLGGFEVIDKIKIVMEDRCPGKVSCADILHLATRDALHLAGAPAYPVFTGRRDGSTSKASSVDLPLPSISLQDTLKYFKSKGLDVADVVTLLGAHTLGKTNCSNIVDRLYNFKGTGKPDPTMNKTSVAILRKQCLPVLKPGKPEPQVFLNPNSGPDYLFRETYYKRLQTHEAVLGVDQQLIYSEDTRKFVDEFATGFEDFRKAFALSISRMGSLGVLTGKKGEIRQNCRHTNMYS